MYYQQKNKSEKDIIDSVYKNLISTKQNSEEIDDNLKKVRIQNQFNETLLNCDSKDNKIIFVIQMVQEIFYNIRFNEKVFFNKDEYTNKRFDTAGYLISQLFKQQFSMLLRSMSFKFQLNSYDHKKLILDYKHSLIDNYIMAALKTGTWGTYTKNRKGISRLLDRLSYLKCVSSLRDIIVTSSEDGSKKYCNEKCRTFTIWICMCRTNSRRGNRRNDQITNNYINNNEL